MLVQNKAGNAICVTCTRITRSCAHGTVGLVRLVGSCHYAQIKCRNPELTVEELNKVRLFFGAKITSLVVGPSAARLVFHSSRKNFHS